MRLLKEAVNLDALHFPAHSNLLIALVANSELAEARERAGLVKARSRNRPCLRSWRCSSGVIERDRDAVGPTWTNCLRRLGRARRPRLPRCNFIARN